MNEQNCFGIIKWSAVRNSASGLLPKHTVVAGGKHRAISIVEQEVVEAMPKDRGAEKGDVGGPLQLGPRHGGS